jgi:hypothetical protein
MAARGPENGRLRAVDVSSDGREVPDAPVDLGAAGLAVWERVWPDGLRSQRRWPPRCADRTHLQGVLLLELRQA